VNLILKLNISLWNQKEQIKTTQGTLPFVLTNTA
jgi:hypothetical protein